MYGLVGACLRNLPISATLREAETGVLVFYPMYREKPGIRLIGQFSRTDHFDTAKQSVSTAPLVMWYAGIGSVLDDGRSTDDGRTEERKKYGPWSPGTWIIHFWKVVSLSEDVDLRFNYDTRYAMQGVLNRKVFMADKQIRYLQKIYSQAQAVPSNTLTSIEARFNRILLVNFTAEQVVRTRALLSGDFDVRAETIGHDDWTTLSVSAGRPKQLDRYDPQVLN